MYLHYTEWLFCRQLTIAKSETATSSWNLQDICVAMRTDQFVKAEKGVKNPFLQKMWKVVDCSQVWPITSQSTKCSDSALDRLQEDCASKVNFYLRGWIKRLSVDVYAMWSYGHSLTCFLFSSCTKPEWCRTWKWCRQHYFTSSQRGFTWTEIAYSNCLL